MREPDRSERCSTNETAKGGGSNPSGDPNILMTIKIMTDKERASKMLNKARVEGGLVAFESVKNLINDCDDTPQEIKDEVEDAICSASEKVREFEEELNQK